MESWMWCFLLCSHLLILYFSPSHSLGPDTIQRISHNVNARGSSLILILWNLSLYLVDIFET
ncbi:hypothetical protein GLYMA_16G168650v4 [Glycine max]|nr:hypothetical protein GLYMA_16G168650v4 [Glycine max]